MAWNITSGFGVAIQIDQPITYEYALIWLPYGNPEDLNGVVQIDVYSEEQGRHSNTYASPGLEKGKPALCVKINNHIELNVLMDYLSL